MYGPGMYGGYPPGGAYMGGTGYVGAPHPMASY